MLCSFHRESVVVVAPLVHRRIHKIQLTVRYLFGFASAFPNMPDRYVWVDALAAHRDHRSWSRHFDHANEADVVRNEVALEDRSPIRYDRVFKARPAAETTPLESPEVDLAAQRLERRRAAAAARMQAPIEEAMPFTRSGEPLRI